MLNEKKIAAREAFKSTKAAYLENPTKENWIKFCDAKRVCMLLGVII